MFILFRCGSERTSETRRNVRLGNTQKDQWKKRRKRDGEVSTMLRTDDDHRCASFLCDSFYFSVVFISFFFFNQGFSRHVRTISKAIAWFQSTTRRDKFRTPTDDDFTVERSYLRAWFDLCRDEKTTMQSVEKVFWRVSMLRFLLWSLPQNSYGPPSSNVIDVFQWIRL